MDPDPELGKFKAGSRSGINHSGSTTLVVIPDHSGEDPAPRFCQLGSGSYSDSQLSFKAKKFSKNFTGNA